MFNPAEYYRKKPSARYSQRYIQGITFRKLSSDERVGKSRHKYEMLENRTEYTRMTGFRISHKYFELFPDGRLIIKKGYRWDGPSGPTVDSPSFMRGSAVHDVFFQCLRENLFMFIRFRCDSWREDLEWKTAFALSNLELKRLCVEDGMWRVRAWWVYESVEAFGHKHALPKEKVA